MESDLLYKDESFLILKACFEIYKKLGCGFLEAVYQECLEIEFDFLKIPYASQRELELFYRGKKLQQTYKPDFICYDKIVVEVKAVSEIASEHKSQLINYLNASGLKVGLLVNFGHSPKLEYQRYILTKDIHE